MQFSSLDQALLDGIKGLPGLSRSIASRKTVVNVFPYITVLTQVDLYGDSFALIVGQKLNAFHNDSCEITFRRIIHPPPID